MLYGPRLNQVGAAYGDGVGGGTRNMATYLDTFTSADFELVPSFHSVRKAGKLANFTFPWRLMKDTFRFIFDIAKYRPAAVHILAQYRGAIYREWVVAVVCKIYRTPYVYGIKAGQFDTWYTQSPRLSKYWTRSMLRHASAILCEGKRYVNFIQSEFGEESVYWPNFVPSSEVLASANLITRSADARLMRVVFVGYCYEGKGVFELVEALDKLSQRGVQIELDLLGHESHEFSTFMNRANLNYNLKVIRHGKSSHDKVLAVMSRANVFCLPTRHPGEGHNNSVNEAMMLGLPIICTRHGFLVDVLGENAAIFIDDHKDIEGAFTRILENPELGFEIAERAKERLQKHLHSDVVIPKLSQIYSEITGKNESNDVRDVAER